MSFKLIPVNKVVKQINTQTPSPNRTQKQDRQINSFKITTINKKINSNCSKSNLSSLKISSHSSFQSILSNDDLNQIISNSNNDQKLDSLFNHLFHNDH
jgi:hypothetical protein